jgi:exopolysaccharide production protein ExoQ
MPATLALSLWLVCLLTLLYFDPARDSRTSWALWIPLSWFFIVSTRLPSQWFGSQVGIAATAFQEGNGLDRTFFLILMLLAIGVLFSRSYNWGGFLANNPALIALIGFALVSTVWSDFPLITAKRWFRDLGNYLMILVVLSDPQPFEAVRTFFRRFCFLLVPLSILLIKYYPNIGIQYSEWTGGAMYVGPTTGKNLLGVICLISGVSLFWDTVTRWSDRKERGTKLIILMNMSFMATSLWLLHITNSATSRVCLIIGCLVIAMLHSSWGSRHGGFIRVLIPASFLLYITLAFGFNLNGRIAEGVGRNPTLTDRTLIWDVVLRQRTDFLVGTGYESFWLGPRLWRIWAEVGPINESHNGYLETYLNLGVIGVFLVGAFLVTSYKSICKSFKSSPILASLSLALWTVAIFYNMTEAAFYWHPVWIAFLVGAIAVPKKVENLLPVPEPYFGHVSERVG